jgi:RHS repeat-associated protein
MRTAATSYYYLTDADGSVLGLVNNTGTLVAGYNYDPTGNRYLNNGLSLSQPYQFQGAYLDPTGLYAMGARSYDPTLARFTPTDPSGKETNPYAAFGNNPANNNDPRGTFSFGNFLKGTGAALGSVAAGITTVSTAPACTTIVGCAPTIAAAGGTLTAGGVTYDYYAKAF